MIIYFNVNKNLEHRCDKALKAAADPGILVRGGAWIFFKGMGSGGCLKASSGSRATPWFGAKGAKPPEASVNFCDFRSKI